MTRQPLNLKNEGKHLLILPPAPSQILPNCYIALKQFLDHCCQIRHFSFMTLKCGSSDCRICKPPRLPKEVFDTLHHLPAATICTSPSLRCMALLPQRKIDHLSTRLLKAMDYHLTLQATSQGMPEELWYALNVASQE